MTMIIQEDSRQQVGKHEIKHRFWQEAGVALCRSKIVVGDYCLPPAVSIDTKESMQEIAQNVGGTRDEHVRFINELKLAQSLGTILYVLVENTDGVRTIADVARWYNPRLDYSPRAITGERLAKALATIQSRYGCKFLFCTPDEAGQVITEILEKQMQKETFIVHADAWTTIQKLNLEQRGALLSALMCKQLGEPLPEMDAATDMAFSFMAAQIDRDNDRYEDIAEKRRNAANARWNMQKMQMHVLHYDTDTVTDTDTDTDKSIYVSADASTKPKRATFKKPTVDEVRAYCQERNNNVDPERFVDYYESNGWKVGRNAMKSWQAAVRTWERSGGGKQTDKAVAAFIGED